MKNINIRREHQENNKFKAFNKHGDRRLKLLSSTVKVQPEEKSVNIRIIDEIYSLAMKKGFKPYFVYHEYCKRVMFHCTNDLQYLASLLGYSSAWVHKATNELKTSTHKWAYNIG